MAGSFTNRTSGAYAVRFLIGIAGFSVAQTENLRSPFLPGQGLKPTNLEPLFDSFNVSAYSDYSIPYDFGVAKL